MRGEAEAGGGRGRGQPDGQAVQNCHAEGGHLGWCADRVRQDTDRDTA